MILPTGRSTPVLAGAAILLVVSVAFFFVFDLSTALGSSSELPIVRIGQKDGQPQGQPTITATTAVVAVAGTAHSASASTTGGDSSQGDQPSPNHSGYQQDGATGTTMREYVEEDVRVQGHWSTTTTTTHSSDDRDGGSDHHDSGGR
jgi:hypothetical protein